MVEVPSLKKQEGLRVEVMRPATDEMWTVKSGVRNQPRVLVGGWALGDKDAGQGQVRGDDEPGFGNVESEMPAGGPTTSGHAGLRLRWWPQTCAQENLHICQPHVTRPFHPLTFPPSPTGMLHLEVRKS